MLQVSQHDIKFYQIESPNVSLAFLLNPGSEVWYDSSLPRGKTTTFLYSLQPQIVCLNINKGQSDSKLMASN